MENAAANVATAAVEAVAQTENAAENAAAIANAALEAAEDRIEAAEEAAENVAMAAMHTEIVRRVDTALSELDQWRNETANRMTDLSMKMDGLAAMVNELKTAPTVVTVIPSSSPGTAQSLTPEALPEPAVIVNPAAASPAATVGASVVPKRPRVRFI